MDLLSQAIIAALIAIGAGVTASITDATKASLTAGYNTLKNRLLEKIGSRHPEVPEALKKLEATPTSNARQAVLVEEITNAQLEKDPELTALAQTLLSQIKQTPAGSQIIQQVTNSAVSFSGDATTYNIQGDQHNTKA